MGRVTRHLAVCTRLAQEEMEGGSFQYGQYWSGVLGIHTPLTKEPSGGG